MIEATAIDTRVDRIRPPSNTQRTLGSVNVGRLLRIGVVGVILMCSSVSSLSAQSILSPYLKDVVSHYAPIVIAETQDAISNPEAVDHILPVDFDGDVIGRNNASNADSGHVVNGKSTVYFSIVESGTTADRGYFFINYYFYHARDAGIDALRPAFVGKGAHEHDLEGVALVVKKSFYSPYGTLVAAYTEAHGALIPYVNPNSTLTLASAGGAPAAGYIRFWTDVNTQVDRPVVAIRSRKHGTYMAQDCSGATPSLDSENGGTFGMWLNSPQQFNGYVACIHPDSQLLIYLPIPIGSPPSSGLVAQRLGPTVRQGRFLYQLIELSASPIWLNRTTSAPGSKLLFGGKFPDPWFLTGGVAGYDSFDPYDEFAAQSSGYMANTPWAWTGGSGECPDIPSGFLGYPLCWYSFGADNNFDGSNPINWPLSPRNGQLLTNPNAEAALRFPSLSQKTEPYRYNPYESPQPLCCSTYPVSGAISGYILIVIHQVTTWTAVAAGGTPPYTYHWSGVLTGSGVSITGSPRASGSLYLNITDAGGHGVDLSTYITVNDPDHCTTKC